MILERDPGIEQGAPQGATEQILEAEKEKGLTFAAIAEKVGTGKV